MIRTTLICGILAVSAGLCPAADGPAPVVDPVGLRVLNHVRAAAGKTGRVWAISYDMAGMPTERIFDVLTTDWKKMVDKGTAIFKVTSSPPAQGHCVGYEGLPSDWYLRLVCEGQRMLRVGRPLSTVIPIKP